MAPGTTSGEECRLRLGFGLALRPGSQNAPRQDAIREVCLPTVAAMSGWVGRHAETATLRSFLLDCVEPVAKRTSWQHSPPYLARESHSGLSAAKDGAGAGHLCWND